MISIARTTNRNVTRWRDGQMVLRWTAAGMLNAERSFRRIKGYKQMPQLVDALQPTRPPRHRIRRCRRIEFTVDRHPNSTRLGTCSPPTGTSSIPLTILRCTTGTDRNLPLAPRDVQPVAPEAVLGAPARRLPVRTR